MYANCWNGYEENRKVILINYHIIELLLPAQIKYLFMLLSIIGIIVGWFVLGFIINFISYGGKPQHEMGKSDTAKALHNILNIITVIALIAVLFS